MDDRAFIRGFEGFHNRRFVGFAALALLVFAVVVGGLVRGFRGNEVTKGADAMALAHGATTQAPASAAAKLSK
jgi:hypothetical protein